jgi:hypothetical protein
MERALDDSRPVPSLASSVFGLRRTTVRRSKYVHSRFDFPHAAQRGLCRSHLNLRLLQVTQDILSAVISYCFALRQSALDWTTWWLEAALDLESL